MLSLHSFRRDWGVFFIIRVLNDLRTWVLWIRSGGTEDERSISWSTEKEASFSWDPARRPRPEVVASGDFNLFNSGYFIFVFVEIILIQGKWWCTKLFKSSILSIFKGNLLWQLGEGFMKSVEGNLELIFRFFFRSRKRHDLWQTRRRKKRGQQ